MLKTIREYENIHVALWLLKDTCWIMGWRTGGMIMIIPTVLMAIDIAWRSRKNIQDLLHNIAVCFWICANGIWMTGEFFYHDQTRKYAMVFFALGLASVAYYYVFIFPKKLKADALMAEKENAPA